MRYSCLKSQLINDHVVYHYFEIRRVTGGPELGSIKNTNSSTV